METNVAHGLVIVQWTLMGVLVLAEVLMVPVRATLKRRDTEHTFQQGTCLGAPGCAMLLARAADDWTFAVVASVRSEGPSHQRSVRWRMHRLHRYQAATRSANPCW